MALEPLPHQRTAGSHERRAWLMVRKSNRAVAALHGLTACATQDNSGISAPIEQDNYLLRPAQTLLNLLQQPARKDLLFAGFLEFVPHIHQLDLRQRTLLHSLPQFDQ